MTGLTSTHKRSMIFPGFFLACYEEKILLPQMPGQRRLAICRLRVPNLDGFVTTTAGNLLSIGTPRHRPDPEITRSQRTNQQKQKGENLKKNLRARVEKKLTRPSARSPGTRKHTYLYLLNCYHFRSYICQINPPFRLASLTSTDNRSKIFSGIFLAC